MILTIQQGTNNTILRLISTNVKKITPQIRQLVLDMTETLDKNQGLGLAAPQVGQNLRIIRVDLSTYCPDPKEKLQYQLTLINPQIIKISWRHSYMEEGCLSLPGEYYQIKRPNKVTVKALNPQGEEIIVKAEGLLAKVIQHEIDHLDGILISDKAK